MTGVQLIVPLDDVDEEGLEKSSNSKIAKQAADSVSANTTATMQEEKKEDDSDKTSSSSTVLSDELREQFEAMKSVWRQARRPSADDLGEQADASEEAKGNAVDEEELRRKQREMAVETALAVDTEISRWKNGIAELEAMLAAEEASDDSSDGDSVENEAEEQIQNERQFCGNRWPSSAAAASPKSHFAAARSASSSRHSISQPSF